MSFKVKLVLVILLINIFVVSLTLYFRSKQIEISIKERMIFRWDDITWNDYENRIESAKKEKSLSHLADYIIDASNTPEDTLEELKKIIEEKID